MHISGYPIEHGKRLPKWVQKEIFNRVKIISNALSKSGYSCEINQSCSSESVYLCIWGRYNPEKYLVISVRNHLRIKPKEGHSYYYLSEYKNWCDLRKAIISQIKEVCA